MLTEIRSDVFRQKSVLFHAGLNVVLGDDNATNSIGKSSLLMVVDFVFAGNTLVEYNTDIIDELGDHYYYFEFDFDGVEYRFCRGTEDSEVVYICDAEYNVTGSMDRSAYAELLKSYYQIGCRSLSFRSMVGLFFRIWGKDNLDVHKPLHTVGNKPYGECVDNLIKIFDAYDAIESLVRKNKEVREEKGALNKAFKKKVIPKIGKKEYEKTSKRIEDIQREISDIGDNLKKYTINLSEIVNREVLELKREKDDLLSIKYRLDSRIERVKGNLTRGRHLRSKNFESLRDFFPGVNEERLAKIEEFHSKVAKALGNELRRERDELEGQVADINHRIGEIDREMGQRLKSVDDPQVIVDRVYELSTELGHARERSRFFEEKCRVDEAEKELRQQLVEEKERILSVIQERVNARIQRIVEEVFGPDRKSPELMLSENKYSYDVLEDTGTGTAYGGMIVLDIAIFEETMLPALVHDSLLFKNVENHSVARLVERYGQSNKQSFIAIDEVGKYGDETASLLRSSSVIQLDDAHVLYVKDWRKG